MACARALANAERSVRWSRELRYQAALLRHRAQILRMRAQLERHDHSCNRSPVVISYAGPAARARIEE